MNRQTHGNDVEVRIPHLGAKTEEQCMYVCSASDQFWDVLLRQQLEV